MLNASSSLSLPPPTGGAEDVPSSSTSTLFEQSPLLHTSASSNSLTRLPPTDASADQGDRRKTARIRFTDDSKEAKTDDEKEAQIELLSLGSPTGGGGGAGASGAGSPALHLQIPRRHSSSAAIPSPRPVSAATAGLNSPRSLSFASTPPIYCRAFRGHVGSVSSVAFSADGRRLASASATDETVRIWDCVTGETIHVLKGHTAPIRKVVFAENGILYALDATSIKIWEPVTGSRMQTMNKEVESLCFSYDGKIMATTFQRVATLFETIGGAVLHTINTESQITCLVFAPVSRDMIAMGFEDGSARIWKLSPAGVATPLHSIACSGGVVASTIPTTPVPLSSNLSLLPDSPRSDSKSPSPQEPEPEQHIHRVNSVAISPDGSVLTTADSSGQARLWDIQSGELLHELRVPPAGSILNLSAVGSSSPSCLHLDDAGTSNLTAAEVLCVAYAPVSPDLPGINARLLATADATGVIRIWDGETGAYIRTLSRNLAETTQINTIAFASSGRILSSGSSDGVVRVWDWNAPPLMASVPGHARSISQIHLSAQPGGKDQGCILGSVGSDGFFKTWNSLSCELINANPPAFVPLSSTSSSSSSSPSSALTCVAFSPSRAPVAAQVAVGGEDGRVRLFDLFGSREVGSFVLVPAETKQARTTAASQMRPAVQQLAFSPDGQHLAVIGREDGTLSVVSVSPSLQYVLQIPASNGSAGRLLGLAWSPDGQTIATSSDSGLVSLYQCSQPDSMNFTLWKNLFGPTDSAPQLAFSPNNRLIGVACQDGCAYVFETRDGSVLHTLSGHRGAVVSIAFSDSNLIATGCEDSNIYLWSASSGSFLYLLEGHIESVCSLVFSSSSHVDGVAYLFSASRDCTIMKWDAHVTNREPPLSYTRRLFLSELNPLDEGASVRSDTFSSTIPSPYSTPLDMLALVPSASSSFFSLLRQHRLRLLSDFPGFVNEREPQSLSAVSAAMSLMAKRRQSRRTLGANTPLTTPRKSELVLMKMQAAGLGEEKQSQVARTLLHFATAQRRSDVLQDLLRSSAARCLIRDDNGASPLDVAIRQQDHTCLSLLLRHVPFLYLHARLPFLHLMGILAESYPQLLLQTVRSLGLERGHPSVQGFIRTLPIAADTRIYAGSTGPRPIALWEQVCRPLITSPLPTSTKPPAPVRLEEELSPRSQSPNPPETRVRVSSTGHMDQKGPSLLPLIAQSANQTVEDLKEDKRKIRELQEAARHVPVVATVVGIPHLAKHWPRAKENPLRVFVALRLSEILDTEAVRAVLDHKWERFGRRLFLTHLISYCIFLTLFTIATVGYSCDTANYTDGGWGVVRGVIDLATALLAFYFWILQLFALWDLGWHYFKSFWNCLNLCAYSVVLLCIPFRLACWPNEDVVQSIAAILLWLRLLYFARGFSTLGPLVAMLLTVFQQVLGFLLVLSLLVAAFAHALFILFRSSSDDTFNGWSSLLSVYNALLGGTQTVDTLSNSPVPGLAIAYYVTFTLLATILMLSLLVALMTRIYSGDSHVIQRGWILDHATLLLDLEASLSSKALQDVTLFPTWLHCMLPASSLSPEVVRGNATAAPVATSSSSGAFDAGLEARLAAHLAPTSKLVTALYARALQSRFS